MTVEHAGLSQRRRGVWQPIGPVPRTQEGREHRRVGARLMVFRFRHLKIGLLLGRHPVTFRQLHFVSPVLRDCQSPAVVPAIAGVSFGLDEPSPLFLGRSHRVTNLQHPPLPIRRMLQGDVQRIFSPESSRAAHAKNQRQHPSDHSPSGGSNTTGSGWLSVLTTALPELRFVQRMFSGWVAVSTGTR